MVKPDKCFKLADRVITLHYSTSLVLKSEMKDNSLFTYCYCKGGNKHFPVKSQRNYLLHMPI